MRIFFHVRVDETQVDEAQDGNNNNNVNVQSDG